MSGLPGLFGAGSGAAGTSFAGPQAAPISNPTNAGQLATAYSGNQSALQQQQALLQALQGQNGIQNQSNVYGQLQGVVNGTGPNPAQAQLAQATGSNVANQAALAAGQRGAASNVGLIARQNAQQGAATQQQAIGQAATLQAQQSLNALNSAGNIANTQVGNQIGATAQNTNAQQAEQAALLGAQQGFNQSQVASQSSINAANAGLANTQLQGQQGLIGGTLNGVSAILAEGGEVKRMADGGDPTVGLPPSQPVVAPTAPVAPALSQPPSGPQSSLGKFLKGVSSQSSTPTAAPMTGAAALQGGASKFASGLIGALKGTPPPQAPAEQPMVAVQQADESPEEKAQDDAVLGTGPQSQARGGMIDYRAGGKVNAKKPSEKAVAKGNSYANDKIKAVLSEHEIVIPRSITMGPDPVNNSARFVAQTIAKRKLKR